MPEAMNPNATAGMNDNGTAVIVDMETGNTNASMVLANVNATQQPSNQNANETDRAEESDSIESQQPETAPESTKDG